MDQSKLLKIRQAYPLELKVEMSKLRIREWYRHWHGEVYIGYSGGIDSETLVDLVRSEYPDVRALFVDTRVDFPENRDMVKKTDNVEIRYPKMTFRQVVDKYGVPIISKMVSMAISRFRNTKIDRVREYRLNGEIDSITGKKKIVGTIPKKWHNLAKNAPFKISEQCCDILKKQPFKKFERDTGLKPYIGTMAEDSNNRAIVFRGRNCNIYDGGTPQSNPLAFWNKDDIWEYIARNDLEYSEAYNKGYHNTGCMGCLFGIHLENDLKKKGKIKEHRFDMLKRTHPRDYDYYMNRMGFKEILDFIGVN